MPSEQSADQTTHMNDTDESRVTLCTILGHRWNRIMKQFNKPDVWECSRCWTKISEYGKPPRWPWVTGYPMEEDCAE